MTEQPFSLAGHSVWLHTLLHGHIPHAGSAAGRQGSGWLHLPVMLGSAMLVQLLQLCC
jgi:hypothetical protein